MRHFQHFCLPLCAVFKHRHVKRLKKHIFLKFIYVAVGVLFVVRLAIDVASPDGRPENIGDGETPANVDSLGQVEDSVGFAVDAGEQSGSCDVNDSLARLEAIASLPSPHPARYRVTDLGRKHPIFSVASYAEAFPDLQDIHYAAATLHGVSPVKNRDEAEHRKSELVYVGTSPFFHIDPSMHRSIPYLVPRASLLLHDIGRAFIDSLIVKHIPLHTLIVTSVLRTEEDVARLRIVNSNASEQSCHRFGTTFDISYYRYHTVCPPDSVCRTVQNDTLKWVLSEVLRDQRAQGRCYVKHEVKQGCFHITTR